MERPKIVVIGSTHMDFIIYVDNLPRKGETVLGKDFKMSPGGKGANQAVAVSRLGAKCYFISKVGNDDIGDKLVENLKVNGVNTDFVFRENIASSIAMIMVDSNGDNIIAVSTTADERLSRRDINSAKDAFYYADIVLVQLEIPSETAAYAIDLASSLGKKVILNPAPAKHIPSRILGKVHILTPNLVELETLGGKHIKSLEEAVLVSRSFIGLGINYVVVTLGARGAMIVDRKEYKVIPTLNVPVVDTTGAGDAFNAALAVYLSQGKDIEEAVEFANIVASLKVTRKGAQEGLPTLEEVEKFIREKL